MSVFLLLAFFLQNPSGSVRGRVSDPSGAPVAGAAIAAHSDSLRREALTNTSGGYWFPDLPAGVYTVQATRSGFAPVESPGVEVTAGGSLTRDFALNLAGRADAVTVTVSAPLVELTNGEASRVLTALELRNTGLAGRNAFLALALLPGVSARAGYFQGDFRGFSQSTGAVQINGQRKDTTLVTLDGINHTEPRAMTRTNSNPGIDFVEEVTILTTHYAAEYGRTTGAQVHYVTRRGTRDFHAAAWEYLLHDKLTAPQFVIGGRPRTRYHNFGWTASGPIRPQRIFFFGGQEFRRLSGFEQRIVTVPTALERQRDFSRSAVRPVDPLAGNTPFPADTIPASRLSPFGQSVLRIYPEPNWTGLGGNFYSLRPAPQFLTDTTARVDYQIAKRWHLYGRTLHSKQDVTSAFSQTGNQIPLFEINQARYGNNYTLALTTTLDPRTTNQLQAGYADFRDRLNIVDQGASRNRFGMENIAEFFSGNRENRIPGIAIGGYAAISGSGHPTFAATPTYSVRDNLSRLAGAHSLKAGVYIELPGVNQINQAADNGNFTFAASAFNPRNARNPLSGALLGYYDQYVESTSPVQTPYRTRMVEFYAQDGWRARRNLSLEFGLRYSILPPWWSAWNNIAAFQPSAFDRTKVPRVNPNGTLVPGSGDRFNGIVLPGEGWPDAARGRVSIASTGEYDRLFRGRPRGLVDTNRGNFQPRFSFAWDPFSRGRTAIRGGGGVFHGPPALTTGGFQLGGLAPFVEQVALTNGDADNPAGGIPSSAVFPLDVAGLPERSKTPTIYSFSFGLQQQLPSRIVLDASYVGNTGRYLPQVRQLNFIPIDVQRANTGRDIRDLLPYPGLQSIGYNETSSTSSYNALQLALHKRMTRGVQLRLAYTLAKAIGYTTEANSPPPQDPANIRADRSELEESRRHVFVIAHLVELPKFRSQPAWLRAVGAGWTWSGTILVSAGRRFDLSINPATGQIATRPDVTRDPNLAADRRSLAAYFDTTALSRPTAFVYGNAGRMILRGPGTLNYDASLAKRFAVSERLALEVRAEFFNASNHPNPNGLVTQFGNRAFGQVNSFAPPRYAQLSGRVNW